MNKVFKKLIGMLKLTKDFSVSWLFKRELVAMMRDSKKGL